MNPSNDRLNLLRAELGQGIRNRECVDDGGILHPLRETTEVVKKGNQTSCTTTLARLQPNDGFVAVNPMFRLNHRQEHIEELFLHTVQHKRNLGTVLVNNLHTICSKVMEVREGRANLVRCHCWRILRFVGVSQKFSHVSS